MNQALTPTRWQRRASPVGHATGLGIGAAGAGMLASAAVDLADGGPDVAALALPGIAVLLVGLALWRSTSVTETLPIRTVFVAIAAAWAAVSAVAALPYLTTGAVDGLLNALFEGVSGVTTTGATVIPDVEAESAGLLFWRSLTQWIGGLGVVVLAVAVLPFLGAGGMSLLRHEVPGPSSERLAPRVRDASRRLWGFYFGLTVAVMLAYLVGGLSPYDATTHAFSTVSTGGFSTREAGFAAFASPTLEWIAVAAMLLGGTNYVLLYRAVRGRPGPLFRSAEFHGYLALLALAAIAVTAWNAGQLGLGHETVRRSVFNVVSLGSTTGFTTADFGAWIQPVQATLLFLMIIGAMTGSTGGGSKMFRLLAALSYARRELRRHIHPRLVGVVRIGREVVPEEVAARILGFHALFFSVVVTGTLVIATFEVDIVTAASAAITSLSNVGPGLGRVSPSGGFLELDAGARAASMILMLVGRVEIYPVLLSVAAAGEAARSRLPRLSRHRYARRLRGPLTEGRPESGEVEASSKPRRRSRTPSRPRR